MKSAVGNKENLSAEKKNASTESPNKKTAVIAVRIAILVVALGLIVAGICNNGMADVFAKAINICTECIGLG